MLQAAERHITDHDMSLDPLWGPVVDGPDPEIMLVGAEAGCDFPELVNTGNIILSVHKSALAQLVAPFMPTEGVPKRKEYLNSYN